MKPLKQLLAVTVLVLTLGMSAYAGDMDMPGIAPPPPPPAPPASVLESSSCGVTSGNIDFFGLEETTINLLSTISIF